MSQPFSISGCLFSTHLSLCYGIFWVREMKSICLAKIWKLVQIHRCLILTKRATNREACATNQTKSLVIFWQPASPSFPAQETFWSLVTKICVLLSPFLLAIWNWSLMIPCAFSLMAFIYSLRWIIRSRIHVSKHEHSFLDETQSLLTFIDYLRTDVMNEDSYDTVCTAGWVWLCCVYLFGCDAHQFALGAEPV